jgi:hypothetical protein
VWKPLAIVCRSDPNTEEETRITVTHIVCQASSTWNSLSAGTTGSRGAQPLDLQSDMPWCLVQMVIPDANIGGDDAAHDS